ncbi:MAG: ABC transporter ATP-binding protein [Lachnospiraceae bacterium]
MKNEFAKIKDAFSKLNFILTGEQKKYSIVVFILSIISALLEMLGVSIIYPLLQAFLNPEGLLNEPYIRPFAQALHLNSYRQVICLVCVAIIVLYILKNAYGVFFVWVSNKYAYKIQRELSVRILVAYMKQGYGFFSENSSARLLRGLGADVSSVYFIINQTFGLLSKVFTIIGIAVLIIIVTPSLSLFLLLLVAFCFILTQLIFRKSMKKYGMLAREYNYKCNQASLEAIQGSKEVLVTNRQDYFINQYQKCMEGSNRASIKNAIGAAAPAYLIEAICVSGLMIVVAVQALSSNEIASMLSQLSVIAVAAFRILPSLGAVLSAVNSIVYHAPALGAAYDTLYMVKELEKQEENEEKIEEQELANIKFQNELVISNITFKYPSRDVNVLEKLNLKIKKGTSVAFIGASGAGKTTLADIILNLLKPQQGEIMMDSYNINMLKGQWNKIIGYVPQSVYLTDASIRRNIAFGIAEEEIDDERVWKALEMAQLKDFVQNLPLQLDTLVGEWGVQFSGGQRQRVAIARALYGEPDILILDEATAALDNDTEAAVMDAIDALQGVKTLIIVAHRLTTIRNCDEIYEIKDGKAIRRSKEEIFSN